MSGTRTADGEHAHKQGYADDTRDLGGRDRIVHRDARHDERLLQVRHLIQLAVSTPCAKREEKSWRNTEARARGRPPAAAAGQQQQLII